MTKKPLPAFLASFARVVYVKGFLDEFLDWLAELLHQQRRQHGFAYRRNYLRRKGRQVAQRDRRFGPVVMEVLRFRRPLDRDPPLVAERIRSPQRTSPPAL